MKTRQHTVEICTLHYVSPPASTLSINPSATEVLEAPKPALLSLTHAGPLIDKPLQKLFQKLG
jgi:hypothetical protein